MEIFQDLLSYLTKNLKEYPFNDSFTLHSHNANNPQSTVRLNKYLLFALC